MNDNRPETPAAIYSPSQTEAWSKCPVYRELAYRQRWRVRTLGKRELAAILGRGVGAGLAMYFSTCDNPDDAAQEARVVAVNAIDEMTALGCQVSEYDRAQALATPTRAAQAVSKFIALHEAGNGLPQWWIIRDVERELPEYGHARIDLGVHDGESPAVLDWKVKLTLKSEYRQKEIDKYRHSGQLLHYNWAYGEYLNVPRMLPRYYIGLIVLEPRFSFELIPFEVGPEDQIKWLVSAQKKWARMAEDSRPGESLTMADNHWDQYGPCEFYRACFRHHWDPSLMQQDYVQLPRRSA